ncbi:hypothetical protein ABZS66_18440 [Dactylosporangium sp. NPDC005572]|uniref:hypothetical protein n=1 Tax=Dactylosporangium sp. NPDC005572 TaxID=3156889 RepID=UPI0033A2B62B
MTLPEPAAPPAAHPPAFIPQQRMPVASWYPPLSPPPLPPPRRSYLWPVLTLLLVFSMLMALLGAGAAAWALRGTDDPPIAASWVDMRPDVGGKAIQGVLQRHADAVKNKDLAAWMADVDDTDATFARKHKQLFENLTKMPFAELRFERAAKPPRKIGGQLPSQLFARYHAAVHVEAVSVVHRIQGVDSKPVATPWLPVFGYADGRWRIAGEATGDDLPTGANGQPWDAAGPVAVKRSDHVVAVVSADDADRADQLLKLAEDGLRQVATVRPSGWDGKVFLTAIQDKRIFDTYFAESPDRVAQVAAIAVPYYDRIPEWVNSPTFASTRVVFNPTELTAQTEELAHDLSHEFAHAAMGPVTGPHTPRWVVEGFAEYVAFKGATVSASGIRQALGNLVIGSFPTDQQFYDEPRNYVSGWLACRMIAEKYGQAKLIAFYEAFQRLSEVDSVSREVLGVAATDLETSWRDYVAKQRG